jgi:hypothetical protein
MTTKTEGGQAFEFLVSEAPGQLSRDSGTLLTGQNLVAGTVLGRVNKIIAAAPIPAIVGTGTGLMSALTFGPFVQTGSYVVTLTATGATAAYTVTAPDGTALPTGNVGTAYVSDQISFLVSSAGTMTTGDAYTVVVTGGGTPVLVGTGTGVISALSLGPNAQNGTYRVQLLATSATAEFEVITPDGDKLKRGQVATAYTSSQINFTLANGGTMTSGDHFNIVVAVSAAGVSKFVAYTPLTYDGRHVPAGILGADTDATSADLAIAAVVRLAEVRLTSLVWATVVTAAQKVSAAAQLAASRFIVAR